MEPEIAIQSAVSFGDIANIILAAALLIFGLRDILVSTIIKDYSDHDNCIVRWFLSRKQQVTAVHLARALGFRNLDHLKRRIIGNKSYDYKKAIKILSKCVRKAENDAKYYYGSSDGKKHNSPYYVDSMGFAQKKESCKELYMLITHLISKIEDDYEYVFSIKGGNMPLSNAFSMDNNSILSVVAKDKNEKVSSGSPYDSFINYEGFPDLVNKAKEKEIKIKGIAIACNLANGSSFLNDIVAYNASIDTLKGSGIIPENIEKIKHVYILYRAIKGTELDDAYEAAGLKCYRYFDLDDNLKACLYSISKDDKDIDDFPCYKCIKGRGKRSKKCEAKYCYKTL